MYSTHTLRTHTYACPTLTHLFLLVLRIFVHVGSTLQMPPKNSKKDDEAEQLTRIAIIDDQKCKPKKCNQE